MTGSNVVYLKKTDSEPKGTPVTVIMFGEVIKEHRKLKKISQAELAERMHVNRNTIVNWETDKIKPDFETLEVLCAILGITKEELFGFSKEQGISADERRLLQDYRQLSDLGKKIAMKTISGILEEEGNALLEMLRHDFFIMEERLQAYTAGEGDDFSDLTVEPVFVRRTQKNENADFIARVKGHSMEPAYMDGDRVYCKKASSASGGQDVVCSMAAGNIIKRMAPDNQTLFSVNPDPQYKFSKKYADDHLRIEGIVLGKVAESDQPPADQIGLLSECFKDDLRAFNTTHSIDE